MNYFRLLSTILFISSVLAIKADNLQIVSIFNGYFFKNVSSIFKKYGHPKDLSIFGIETPEGKSITGFYSPSLEISDELISFSISPDSITEGEELLRRFNDYILRDKLIRENGEKIKVGDTIQDFSATDIEGKVWSNQDVKGKVMVLNQWFTGCRPCRQEMPELSEWKDEMPDVMFFSSTYETPEVARQVLDKVRFNWIPIVNDKQFCKWIGDKGYPMTIIIDKEGKIVMIEYGTSPEKREAIKHTIESLR